MRNSGYFQRLKSQFLCGDACTDVAGEISLEKTTGLCRICNINSPNSNDHFPLESMGNQGRWYYRNYYNFRANSLGNKLGICQNGIVFKTICDKCNSRLGRFYDPSLLSLFNQFKEKSGLVRIQYDGRKILKCLAGHFLAASTSDELTPRDVEFRSILNTESTYDYRIFIAKYPGYYSAVIREFAFSESKMDTLKIMNILKINPIAIILTKEQIIADGYYEITTTDNQMIRIDLDNSCHLYYPEMTIGRYGTKQGILFGKDSAESVIGVPKLWESNKTHSRRNK